MVRMKMTATSGIPKFPSREKINTCQNIGGRQHRTTPTGQILGVVTPANPAALTPMAVARRPLNLDSRNWIRKPKPSTRERLAQYCTTVRNRWINFRLEVKRQSVGIKVFSFAVMVICRYSYGVNSFPPRFWISCDICLRHTGCMTLQILSICGAVACCQVAKLSHLAQ